MGLLTDPSAGQGKLIKLLLKYYRKLCILLYLGGVTYFVLLASPQLNGRTYISENALLPGLVKSEFWDDGSARTYHQELLDEMVKYDSSVPYPWLLAKFRQIGLDTYTHNFSLKYPLGARNSFSGKNVYGILRAPRAASTEALVLSVPYRPPNSVHATTAPSIAIMLTFAKFAADKKFWAKDIIFLVTEHEQLGMQAWLEAYHGITCGQQNVLIAGDMKGRAGAIQAAINLEFHSPDIGVIDLKVEGLNGQLPNLDLFNLVTKLIIKENIWHTFKGRANKKFNDFYGEWKYSVQTMLSMVGTQATGIPNGNHGLFYRFGIQAVTLEGFTTNSPALVRSYFTQGRLLEGIFRSLNNLLERFHQSFFFYLLAGSDRYISIGLYIPAICVLAATLFITAYATWCQLHDISQQADSSAIVEDVVDDDLNDKDDNKLLISREMGEKMSISDWKEVFHREVERESETQTNQINLGYVGLTIALSHVLGFSLQHVHHYLPLLTAPPFPTEHLIHMTLSLITAVTIALPVLPGPLAPRCHRTMTLLQVLALLELATLTLCLAMYNPSLAVGLATLYVPAVSLLSMRYVRRVVWLLCHPFVVFHVVVLVYTCVSFPDRKSVV